MKTGRLAAVALAVSLCVVPALSIHAGSMSSAQKQKEALEEQLKEAETLVEELKSSKEDISAKVEELDKKLTDISMQIVDLEEQLDEKNKSIDETQNELEQLCHEESAQYDLMKKRIQFMYENQDRMSVWIALVESGSLKDFLSQINVIREIMRYDRQMLEQYQGLVSDVENTEGKLQEESQALEDMKKQVQEERKSVEGLLLAKEQELSGVSGELSSAQTNVDAVAAEIQAQEEIIEQIRQEEKRKEAERLAAIEAAKKQQQSTEQPMEGEIPEDVYLGGEFLWPCPSSTRVTSDYGNRLAPTEGASSNHKGIDIGAAYGADIIAVADGDVVFAGYNAALGNYVMLSHGGGVYTVYGHCSALLVSTGDTVSAGQSIAQVGSTGISTGNHLHFGVSENGQYVSPWNYLR